MCTREELAGPGCQWSIARGSLVSDWCMVLFKPSLSSLIFDLLPHLERKIFKSPTMVGGVALHTESPRPLKIHILKSPNVTIFKEGTSQGVMRIPQDHKDGY